MICFYKTYVPERIDPEIERKLSFLPREEKQDLKELFEWHLFFSDFSYTLFGSKPMSIGRHLPTLKAKNGWLAWQKVQPFFKSSKFILRKYRQNGVEFILIANVQEVKRVYSMHQAIFIQEFPEINVETLVRALSEGGQLFDEILTRHWLLGILLGYGVNNARLFSERQNGKEKIKLLPFSRKLHPIFYYFSKIMPVTFACDIATEETQELKTYYSQERKKIILAAKKSSLFTLMLRHLLDEDSQREKVI